MEEIDLIELLKLFWRKKILIILIILCFTAIGYIYTTKYVTPQYDATTTLVLATIDDKNNTNTSAIASEITINSKLVSTYTELIKSKSILEEVILKLRINMKEEELRKSISVSTQSNTSLIDLKVTNENAEYSSKIANELANTFIEKISDIYNIKNVQIVSKAEVPVTPSNINHKKDIITFSLIGIVISVLFVMIVNIFDTTVKSADEIEKMFDLPILVSIPMYEAKKQKGGK